MRNLEENMPESSSVTEKTLKTKLMNAYGDQVMFFSNEEKTNSI